MAEKHREKREKRESSCTEPCRARKQCRDTNKNRRARPPRRAAGPDENNEKTGCGMGENLHTILVIDDDPDYLNIVTTILESGGYEVITATDPETGSRMAAEKKPALILLDVIFYGDTLGFEYCRKLKKDPATKAIPIVMVTSVGEVYGGIDFWPADPDMLPASDFITKPVRKADLLERIGKVLAAGK